MLKNCRCTQIPFHKPQFQNRIKFSFPSPKSDRLLQIAQHRPTQTQRTGGMDEETRDKIVETVLEILKNSNMEETTEFKIRKSASEKLGMDLSDPTRKKFVRQVVESYLTEQQAKAAEEEEQQQQQEEGQEEEGSRKRGGKEFDDEGGLIICRLSDKRRVTLSEFRGKTLVSIREYYKRDGKELPSAKGISLTAEQWGSFKKNVPAIEKAIKKMEDR